MVNDIVSVNLPMFKGFSMHIYRLCFMARGTPQNRNVLQNQTYGTFFTFFFFFFLYLKTSFGRLYRVDDY